MRRKSNSGYSEKQKRKSRTCNQVCLERRSVKRHKRESKREATRGVWFTARKRASSWDCRRESKRRWTLGGSEGKVEKRGCSQCEQNVKKISKVRSPFVGKSLTKGKRSRSVTGLLKKNVECCAKQFRIEWNCFDSFESLIGSI